MRDFLPYKSYRLLDATWMLCCAVGTRNTGEGRQVLAETTTQLLRGPEGQEYELKLTSRAENGRVFVRFALFGAAEGEVAAATVDHEANARRLAEAQDRKAFIETQLQEARKRVEVGTAPKSEVAKLELELRSEQRRIDDYAARASRPGTVASTRPGFQSNRAVLDTSFTMDVGETVVVGTSRLKGGSKALIALLTAVPPRSGK
jgi:hypothetical protein